MITSKEKAIKKFKKGWMLVKTFNYGLATFIWLRDKKVSLYPRVNEDLYCELRDVITPYGGAEIFLLES